MELTGDVRLAGKRKDIHGDPPHDTASRQGSGVGVRVLRKKAGQLLAIGEIVKACWCFPSWMEGGAWMVVKLGPFQLLGVKNLEGHPFLYQVED